MKNNKINQLHELSLKEQVQTNGGVITVGVTFIVASVTLLLTGIEVGMHIGDHYWPHYNK